MVRQVGTPRPIAFVVKVLLDVGSGLLAARSNRVVHMDVKAANVVLDWEGPDSRYATNRQHQPAPSLLGGFRNFVVPLILSSGRQS